jgi:uncharacterized membrane protein (DUF4010 family)
LFLIPIVQARWGSSAIVATSAFVGLTDLDALTLSLARRVDVADVQQTTVALAAGILSNTLLKMMVAGVVGRGRFRAAAAGSLGAIALAIAAMLWLRR